jgi:translation initiation factor 4G
MFQSALASLDTSGEGADDVVSPPSTASSPALAKSVPSSTKASEGDSKSP